jgi:hypothetical protein
MPVLTNDPGRCEVLNLSWAHAGQGPYLVRQEGYAPDSTDFRSQRFILQKDGRWLINLAFVMLPEAEQEKQLFHSQTEVLLFLDERSGKPVLADAKLPPGIRPEEIMVHFEQCSNRLLRGMRNCTVMPARE